LTRTAFILLIVLAAGGLYLVYTLSRNPGGGIALQEKKVVGVGDVVVVNFISRTQDKKIVDTSYADIAKAEGVYDPERTYIPITFTVGSGEVLEGIEKGVVGMADGEKKTITVSPEDGFGEYNPQLLQVAPKIYPVDRVSNIPLERYRSVVSSEPVPNTTVVDPNIPWPMFIINVSNETVYIKYTPEEGLVFQSMLGLAQVVAVSEDQVLIEEKPVNDSIISTATGPASVYDLNDTAILLDYNHPFAGKTLLYELKVEGIVKTNKSG
jgi:FKBP-type peptidyl-prolyl cis-trans isomerase 2